MRSHSVPSLATHSVPSLAFVVIDTASASRAGTAINDAITALPAAGGTIIVPAGNWTIDTTVLISKSGVILRGVSQQATVLRFAGSTMAAAIRMSDAVQRDVVIEDMRIESASSGRGTAIDASHFVNSTIRNVRIGNGGTSPRVGVDFHANGSHYNVVENCRIAVSGANSACVRYANASNSNVLRNCRLFGDNTHTVGVSVDAHAVCIDHIDIETDFLIGVDVTGNGHDCLVIAPYIEAGETGIRLAADVESFTCLGGVIIDNVWPTSPTRAPRTRCS